MQKKNSEIQKDVSLGREFAALLHETSHSEPERVEESELVLQDVGARITRMGIGPLVGAEAGHNEEEKTHAEEGRSHVHPHLQRQGRQERKELRYLLGRFAEEDTDAKVHEGHREIDGLFPLISDRQVTYRNVSPLPQKKEPVS
ncbi:hypothetical protein TNIN_407611 [Trichonephila inaurata madagascariensis]|uniref:Uncharacterized protein n=1 Tax=Trichonephila inaurata madagascariensis TaxID=2747483 RepID=A0A8X6XIM7_9ARAC|nr:hypothetical protein TNIN_407611 [Trichonephila inaurata madagascariensis]